MASLIPDYEYDIFISYRQKDNKYDGWVTEFVTNLKKELEATFKEDVSVYFDINPHDGLLETHDVDASLKEKLKCLVFIPIISRTYCDPKSFAWEHEFKAFVKQASQDKFGLKAKLPNGNVASRVLPVRIHDLDIADIKECESVLGGVLRGVEFIYKESGIDKPLSHEDDEKKNLNNTKYRIQIIKVAHAIKEIILGIKTEPVLVEKEKLRVGKPLQEVRKDEKMKLQEKHTKISKLKLLSGVTILAILIIAAVLVYQKIIKGETLEKLRSSGEKISIAVMPFQNMTIDTTWNVWQDGIQDMLISSLSNSPEELVVRQTESINNLIQSKGFTNYASITPSFASNISKKLNANVFIYGNIKQAGSTIRVYAQLIDSKTEEVFKSFQIESAVKEENIFRIIDSLSMMIKDFLIISKLKNEITPDIQTFAPLTYSPEAYRYFISGENARRMFDNKLAAKYYSQAIAIDSNFTYAIIMLSYSFINQGIFDQPKSLCLKVYRKKEMMNTRDRIRVDELYAELFETPMEKIKCWRELQKIDNQNPIIYFQIGFSYETLSQFTNAISEYEKSLEIYKNWNLKPYFPPNYTNLGRLYHQTGQLRKERKLYKKAEQDFPDDPLLIYRKAVLALSEGKTKDANDFIEKYKSTSKEYSAAESMIEKGIANIYSDAMILDKAEELYRQALLSSPIDPYWKFTLAYFLIDKDRNIKEGLELADTLLKLSPENYNYLHTKGWGLYKQGKYQEALDILQKSWDLRMKNAVYDHEAFLHLEAAKKAVASQKNN
jgi:tetratricopeptide (TPR) repeat protein